MRVAGAEPGWTRLSPRPILATEAFLSMTDYDDVKA